MQAFRRSTASALRNAAAVQQRGYANAPAYAETINNLRINADTKVIFQGFTGKQGTYVYFRSSVVSYMMLTLHFCPPAVSTLSKPLPTVFFSPSHTSVIDMCDNMDNVAYST